MHTVLIPRQNLDFMLWWLVPDDVHVLPAIGAALRQYAEPGFFAAGFEKVEWGFRRWSHPRSLLNDIRCTET
jgi:hypothetical protein